MLRRLPLLLAAALLAVVACADAAITPTTPLCRVVGSWRPASWVQVPYLPRIGTATLALRPGCPADGLARVRFVTPWGATRPEVGFYILTPQFPSLTRSGVPEYYAGQWQAASGVTYVFPLVGARP